MMTPTVVIRINSFHPAIVKALDKRNVEAMREEINALYAEQDGKDADSTVKSKAGKESVSFTLAAKTTAKLPKNHPGTLLADIHWYLVNAAVHFCRVEEVTLPISVVTWAKAEKFNVEVAAPAPAPAPSN